MWASHMLGGGVLEWHGLEIMKTGFRKQDIFPRVKTEKRYKSAIKYCSEPMFWVAFDDEPLTSVMEAMKRHFSSVPGDKGLHELSYYVVTCRGVCGAHCGLWSSDSHWPGLLENNVDRE